MSWSRTGGSGKNQEPGTGGRGPGTRDRGPGAKRRGPGPGTKGRRLGTGDRDPGPRDEDRRPGTKRRGSGARGRGRGPGAYRGRYGIACEGTCRVRGSSGRHGLSAGIRKAAPWEPLAVSWCPGRDLNPHTFRQRFLRPSCLPFHHPGLGASTQYSGNAVRRREETVEGPHAGAMRGGVGSATVVFDAGSAVAVAAHRREEVPGRSWRWHGAPSHGANVWERFARPIRTTA